jgi:hypothetical protein
LALELLIELEMIEFSEDKIYSVKNFAKHQGIKIKEKEVSNIKEENVENINVSLNENFKVSINDDKGIVVDDSIEKEKSSDSLQGDIPIILETKKSTKRNKKQKDKIMDIIVTDEKIKDNSTCCIYDGVIPLREGESSILEWSFG